jgi:hypothetical protein
MRLPVGLCVFIVACSSSSSTPLMTSDTGGSAVDAQAQDAQAEDAQSQDVQSMPLADAGNQTQDSGPSDAGSMGQCPCAMGYYCDLATNTCKPGCADNTACASGYCDLSTRQCGAAPTMCVGQRCMPGQVCCQMGSSVACGNACTNGVLVGCTGPSDCIAQTPLCCSSVFLDMMCHPTGMAQCVATCAPTEPTGCNQMEQLVVCHTKTDCAQDPAHGNCCSFPTLGLLGSVCVSAGLATLGTCVP